MSSPLALDTDWSSVDSRTVLAPHGDLDLHTAGGVRRMAFEALDSAAELVVDLTELRFIDSMGVGALIAIRREALSAEVALSVVCPRGPVLRVLEMMRIDAIVSLYPTMDSLPVLSGPARI